MRLVQIADEIVNILASDPNATLKITVEINAAQRSLSYSEIFSV
jgi:hypothetical protein